MKRRYNLRKIANKRTYTMEEIGKSLNVHVQTVRKWRKEGLRPIKENSSPFLFLGSDIRSYLQAEYKKQQFSLSKEEIYCLKCRKPAIPEGAYLLDRGVTIGKGTESFFLVGTCSTCGKELRKFASKSAHPNKKIVSINNTEIPMPRHEEQIGLFEKRR